MTEEFINGCGRLLEIRWRPYRERHLGWVNRVLLARRNFWVRQHPKDQNLGRRRFGLERDGRK